MRSVQLAELVVRDLRRLEVLRGLRMCVQVGGRYGVNKSRASKMRWGGEGSNRRKTSEEENCRS